MDAVDLFESMEERSSAVRPKLRVKDILTTIEPKNFTIPSSATVGDAIAHLVTEKLASALVVSSDNGVEGIFTARDLLKFIKDFSERHPRGLEEELRSTSITEVMTKRGKLVYCSPEDSVRRCREIMFQCKIRNMPVIDGGIVKGILTMKVLADSSFNLSDTGGKKGFIHNVTGRRGVPDNVKVLTNPKSPNALSTATLDAEVGVFALPHPFKRAEGIAMDRRHYGAQELSEDLSVIEDAYFALRIADPNSNTTAAEGERSHSWAEPESSPEASPASSESSLLPLAASDTPSQLYLCVADGVGSWRQYGIDPRQYSHRLVENARKVIEADFTHRALVRHSPFESDLTPIHPLDVIMDAWNLTTSEEVSGSSTICVATLDKKLNQLSYSNVGDCGLMVVRRSELETSGTIRERTAPRDKRRTDLRIAYLSQQQLKSFNLPYQLGFSTIAEVPNANFESPADADTASIPVMPGDVIVLATDGLFDNVDLDDIVSVVADWEAEFFSAPEESTTARSPRGNAAVQALAERLVRMARELSLDASRDSPFAVLAKENDIMWGGGMPDDTTVVVARIVNA